MTAARYFKAKNDILAIRKAWQIFKKEQEALHNRSCLPLFMIGLWRFKDPRFKTGEEWDVWNKIELPV